MVKDAKGQAWCMVLVERKNGTAFLDLIPSDDADLAVLGVFAFAAHPNAAEITYTDHSSKITHTLVRPWRDGAIG